MEHDFYADLETSSGLAQHPFWLDVYTCVFPFIDSVEYVTDLDKQRQGIDRLLHSKQAGVTYSVEEKVRYKDYPDFLLETISNDATGTAGWIEKDLSCDYFSYLVTPIRRVYVMRWKDLRGAWILNKDRWTQRHGTILALNKGYNTVSVPVPIRSVASLVKIRCVQYLEGRWLLVPLD